MRVQNSICVSTGKGGVGKTSIASNVAAHLAASGQPVLAVDLDPQADLAAEWGVEEHDEGKSLMACALGVTDAPLPIEARPGLRLLPGGAELHKIVAASKALASDIGRSIAAARFPDEWIVIDTPAAAGNPLSDAALAIAERVAIPTREDAHSINGVAEVLERAIGVGCEPSGVICFAAALSATAINETWRETLTDALGDDVPILGQIRESKAAQLDAKAVGVTVAELAQMKAPGVRIAGNTAALAADYAALAEAIRGVMTNG